ncbi:MAG TPA: hypothetical protein VGX91_10595 [Candidatus Cybelea sp.]|jgi:hypothetical protein|nr:hypothetical protein [Candidatus Cybelea sp.]
MMHDQRKRDAGREEHRFVLHLWREPSSSRGAWRGSIYEVASAARIASGKLRDLWDFVTLRLGQDPDERAPEEALGDE